MVESPVLNGCSHLMVCALALSPLEYTQREQCADGDGNGCRCTRAEINFGIIVPAGGTSAARL